MSRRTPFSDRDESDIAYEMGYEAGGRGDLMRIKYQKETLEQAYERGYAAGRVRLKESRPVSGESPGPVDATVQTEG